MKHKRNRMSLEDVINRSIQIKEKSKTRDKAKKANELFSKANLVEKKVKSNKNNVQVKKIKLQAQPNEQCPKPQNKEKMDQVVDVGLPSTSMEEKCIYLLRQLYQKKMRNRYLWVAQDHMKGLQKESAFILYTIKNTYVIIYLYINDIYANSKNRINHVYETKRFLSSNFNMKDLGEAKVILGIKITRIPNELELS